MFCAEGVRSAAFFRIPFGRGAAALGGGECRASDMAVVVQRCKAVDGSEMQGWLDVSVDGWVDEWLLGGSRDPACCSRDLTGRTQFGPSK